MYIYLQIAGKTESLTKSVTRHIFQHGHSRRDIHLYSGQPASVSRSWPPYILRNLSRNSILSSAAVAAAAKKIRPGDRSVFVFLLPLFLTVPVDARLPSNCQLLEGLKLNNNDNTPFLVFLPRHCVFFCPLLFRGDVLFILFFREKNLSQQNK